MTTYELKRHQDELQHTQHLWKQPLTICNCRCSYQMQSQKLALVWAWPRSSTTWKLWSVLS